MKQKKWTIVAYPECDEGYLPRKEKVIEAPDWNTAIKAAYKAFPEYHEVGAYEVEEK